MSEYRQFAKCSQFLMDFLKMEQQTKIQDDVLYITFFGEKNERESGK